MLLPSKLIAYSRQDQSKNWSICFMNESIRHWFNAIRGHMQTITRNVLILFAGSKLHDNNLKERNDEAYINVGIIIA